MPPFRDFKGWGQLARVRYVDGRWVFVVLPNGQLGWMETREPVDFPPETAVHITDEQIEEVPAAVWREEPWVAVVRIKNPDVTVVEISGQARIVPTNGVNYKRGNTVEVLSTGVVRVLDEEPLRIIDFPAIDEKTAEQFIIRDDSNAPTFDDFGGLPGVVNRAIKLVETPLKYADALKKINARQVRGVLFTGEPGTGKTMLARIIAGQSKATFYNISGPEIISKWYGQSEELLRILFEHATSRPSAILFFDEIDSIAAKRDEDAHEASRRLVAQLLTLMDGFKRDGNVVVIATTNRLGDIDPALRRPGRFDWEINFPLPNQEDRAAILVASARKIRIAGPLPHARIAEMTETWSAADLAAIWTEAAMFAAVDGRDAIILEDYIGGFEAVKEQRLRASLEKK
jgi:transitional endoplasmic reticulum ATPase